VVPTTSLMWQATGGGLERLCRLIRTESPVPACPSVCRGIITTTKNHELVDVFN